MMDQTARIREDERAIQSVMARTPSTAPLLELRNVGKTFVSDKLTINALAQVCLTVHKGEFVSLIGPSGCGKTTLLRIVAGLTSKTSGELYLRGELLSGPSRQMAFVFQDIGLLPWRSVLRNVEIGLEARGVDKATRRQRALDALELVGVAETADRPPYQLSGGMQQRVGVARALAVHPAALLMDEPFGHLDNFTRERLQIEIMKLWEQLGMAVLFVTHDVDEAILLSDRIALLRGSPGRVIEIIDVRLPRPRWSYDVRARTEAIDLRAHIVGQLGADAGEQEGQQ
ncbi:MAG: ABC transporter ATP-binding protein [Streptosporangiaceae bacterium]